MPSSFADQQYWEQRFAKDRSSFDWLLPAADVRDAVANILSSASSKILHIGCGTSELSFHLRELVPHAEQVHNIDYSQAAVDAGSTTELEYLQAHGQQTKDRMEWSQADLLSFPPLPTASSTTYDVVVDKSTSDAMSCGEDIHVNLPYAVVKEDFKKASSELSSAKIHPLHILAVHLASLTTPSTGHWLVVSYSDERFPFLPPYPRSSADGLLDESVVDARFPHPGDLWELERKWKVKAPVKQTADRPYQPDVYHWFYVLVRTDVRLRPPVSHEAESGYVAVPPTCDGVGCLDLCAPLAKRYPSEGRAPLHGHGDRNASRHGGK